MNESTIQKSKAVLKVRDSQMQFLMGVRRVAWFVVLMLANLPILTFAQSPCPGIHVEIQNIRNSSGSVACGLFESPDGFHTKYLISATNIMITKVRDN